MPNNGPANQARNKLLELEKRRQLAIVAEFSKIQKRLENQIADLLIEIERQRKVEGNARPGLILQKVRLSEILDAVTDEINKSSKRLAAIAEGSQSNAVTIAERQSAAYPALRAELGFFDSDAVKELIGIAGDGRPLDVAFKRLAKPIRQAMFDALFFGISAGSSNATIAREVRQAIGGGTAAAMTIVRTETNRAYREATRKYYAEVPGVIGWRWLAALDLRTCPICWALHGRIFKTKTKFGTHPNCRCTMVPVFADDPKPETGPELFAKLNDTQKKAILGPKRYELYLQGAELSDFVATTKTPFGIGRKVKNLAETKFKPKPRRGVEPIPPAKGGAVPVARPIPKKPKTAVTPAAALSAGGFTPEDARDMRAEFVADVGPVWKDLEKQRDEIKMSLDAINQNTNQRMQAIGVWYDTDREKYIKLRSEIWDDADRQRKTFTDQLSVINNKTRLQVVGDRARFYTDNPIELDAVQNKGRFDADDKDALKDAVADFNRLVDAAAWKNPNKRIGVNKRRGRAYYSSGQIYVNPSESRRTVVHEIGHAFEKFNADILKQANGFLDHRAGGELPVRLSKLYPGYRYRRDEVARKDKFTNAYIGKVYGPIGNQEYTEVISMGIESLYAEPYKLAMEDPEFFEFILTVVRGGLWRPLS